MGPRGPPGPPGLSVSIVFLDYVYFFKKKHAVSYSILLSATLILYEIY